MKIDIDTLTEAALVDLNNRIVERLRFLNQIRAHAHMLEFKIGDRVSFEPEGRPLVVGMLTRYNRKTVTVITRLTTGSRTFKNIDDVLWKSSGFVILGLSDQAHLLIVVHAYREPDIIRVISRGRQTSVRGSVMKKVVAERRRPIDFSRAKRGPVVTPEPGTSAR